MLIGIAFIVTGVCLLIPAGLYFTAGWVFAHCPDKTGRTGGHILEKKYQHGVTELVRQNMHSSATKRVYIRHRTKCVYWYAANGKKFKIRDAVYGTARQVPRTVTVWYWKAFPRFAYIKGGELWFELSGVLFLFWALSLIGLGIALCT